MHPSKTHRIYTILSKNLTFIGMSMDEWGIAVTGMVGGMVLLSENNGFYGLMCVGASITGIWALKRFKKLSEGFSFKSFLYAYGYWFSPSTTYPSFKHKVYAR